MSKVIVIGSLAESLVNFRGDLLRALVAQGHEVLAAAPAAPAWVCERLAQWQVRFVELPLARTGTNLIHDLRLLRFLRRLFLQERPAVVLGYTIKPVIYGSLAARMAGVPRIAAMITGLGFTFMPPPSARAALVQWLARTLYKAALQRCAVIYFQNADDEGEFRQRQLIPSSARVVRLNGSGVNLARYPPAPWPEGDMNFLFVGRLIKDKGIGEYIAAARSLQRAGVAAQCHVVGPFDDNPSAMSATDVRAAVADGSVVHHGAVQDVRPYLARCHVLVLPSYREGTPRSVLEALATGRPVLTTDAPGCRDTVAGADCGWLVPPGDATALAGAMLGLCQQGPQALATKGRAARQQAEAKYDVHRVNEVLIGALLPHAHQTSA